MEGAGCGRNKKAKVTDPRGFKGVREREMGSKSSQRVGHLTVTRRSLFGKKRNSEVSMKLTEGVMKKLIVVLVMLVAGCTSTMLSDDRIRSNTAGALGVAEGDITIS